MVPQQAAQRVEPTTQRVHGIGGGEYDGSNIDDGAGGDRRGIWHVDEHDIANLQLPRMDACLRRSSGVGFHGTY